LEFGSDAKMAGLISKKLKRASSNVAEMRRIVAIVPWRGKRL
jgi:hypothetical protein